MPDKMLFGSHLALVPAVLASTQSVPKNVLTQCSALANELSATNTPDAAFSLCLSAHASALEAHNAKKGQDELSMLEENVDDQDLVSFGEKVAQELGGGSHDMFIQMAESGVAMLSDPLPSSNGDGAVQLMEADEAGVRVNRDDPMGVPRLLKYMAAPMQAITLVLGLITRTSLSTMTLARFSKGGSSYKLSILLILILADRVKAANVASQCSCYAAQYPNEDMSYMSSYGCFCNVCGCGGNCRVGPCSCLGPAQCCERSPDGSFLFHLRKASLA